MKIARIGLGIVLAFVLFSTVSAEETAPPLETAPVVADYTVPQPAAAPVGGGNLFIALAKLGLILVGLTLLIYATVFGLKILTAHRQPPRGMESGMLEIVDTLVIGPNKIIQLLNVYKERLLVISTTDKDVRVLDSISDPQKIDEILNKVNAKWEKTRTFSEHFSLSTRKMMAQDLIRGKINNLKEFVVSLKGKKKHE